MAIQLYKQIRVANSKRLVSLLALPHSVSLSFRLPKTQHFLNTRINLIDYWKMRRFWLLLCVLGTAWSYEVEKVTEPLEGGEGPHWSAERQLLYFVDLDNATINVYDPSTGVHNSTNVGQDHVSFIIPVEGTTDEFVVGSQLDIRYVIWDGQQDSTPASTILFTAPQDADGSKFNDAKVDGFGYLWAGTMGPTSSDMQITERNGKLYRVSESTGITAYVESILLSNGMAWNSDGSIMYYTDSFDGTVDSFDYDASAEPPLSNRQVVFNYTASGLRGSTDGLTIDTDGYLWLACMGAAQVIQVNPSNGTVLMSVPINATKVTSLTWGGANLDELYVTSSKSGVTDDELLTYPDSGATWRITGLDARGYAANSYPMYNTTSTSSSSIPTTPLLFILSFAVITTQFQLVR